MNTQHLLTLLHQAKLDESMVRALSDFFISYQKALSSAHDTSTDPTSLFERYIRFIQDEVLHPTTFNHFHASERFPFDFYEFGRSIVRPLIDIPHSFILGEENVQSIVRATEAGDNVILLANHQTEIDPQIISLLLTPLSDNLATSMIFVAGHRVTTDPLAIPLSRGVNLLSIFSKKYIAFPPEKKSEKLVHNAKTLAKLEDLLNEGGKCIYVAPSGGRDRHDESMKVAIAPFDPQSVEMFSLLSQKATQTTHLHLLALSTIKLLPPPPTTSVELGESRNVAFAPARLAFGPALDMDALGDSPDKKQRRIERAEFLTATIEQMHAALKNQV
jgi:glycerol-3-phosphate O-acyltransferase